MTLDDDFVETQVARIRPNLAEDLRQWKESAKPVVVLGIVGKREASKDLPVGALMASMTRPSQVSRWLMKLDLGLATRVITLPPPGFFWIVVVSDSKVGMKAEPWPKTQGEMS